MGLAAALAISASSGARAGEPVCEREMARAASANAIPLDILYSVGLTETGRKGQLSPYDMNIDGRSLHAETLAGAIADVGAARSQGARLIDVGCMQINIRWHGADFASLDAMFDPARNVEYAAHFLKELKAREGSWTLAVARYNAGPGNPAAQKAYVCAVIANLVRSGMGSWTEGARAFCR